MTRFLFLALADFECGGVNRETERLFAYLSLAKIQNAFEMNTMRSRL
jgi:hypothetical protein